MKYYKFLTKNTTKLYIIYVVLFSIIAYIVCLHSSIQDFKHEAKLTTTAVNNNIHEAMQYTFNVSNTIQNSHEINQYIVSKKDRSYYTIDALSFINTAGANRPDAIVDFGILNLNNNHILTTDGYFDIKYFSMIHDIDYTSLCNIAKRCINKSNPTTFQIIKQNSKNNLAIMYSHPFHNNGFPMIFIYNMDSFTKNISINTKNGNICTEFDNIIVYTKSNIGITNKNKLTTLKSVASTSETGYFYTVKTSYLIDKVSYFHRTNSFFALFLLILFAAIFITLYISKKFARKLYLPMQNFIDKITSSSEANDEFELIENKFYSLEESNSALSSIIKDYKVSMEDQFWINLLQNVVPNNDISDKLNEFNINKIKFPLCVCIVKHKNYSELLQNFGPNGMCEIHTMVKSCFEQELNKNIVFKLLTINLQTYAIIIKHTSYEHSKEMLLPTIFKIETMLDVELSASIGTPVRKIADLSQSYNFAIALHQEFVLFSSNNIVLTPDNKSESTNFVTFTPEQENSIINAVLSCNPVNVRSTISPLINNYMNNGLLTIEQHAHLVMILYSIFLKILSMMNKTEKELFGHDISIYLELKQCTTNIDMNTKLTQLFGVIIKEIKSTSQSADEQLGSAMVDYIAKNYNTAISLISLSTALNMSQYYVSRQFKQIIGENFKDYLAKYRINQAIKAFIKNPNIKIKQVAEDVGYNVATFSRVFNQYQGTTPAKYLEKLKATEKYENINIGYHE